MRDSPYLWLAGLGVTLLIIAIPVYLFTLDPPAVTADPWAFVPDRSTAPTDHVPLLPGPYATGSDVTRACLECHERAGEQVIHTAHFTWLSEPVSVEGRDEPVQTGKANLLNNFCIGVQSNWGGCTRCHAGYGWSSADYDFTNAENVDCLVCHDQTGTYVKAAAGQPAEGVDLAYVAQNVGTPSRQNCGGCHFDGGGGNGVKHGDLDESLYFPPESVDVHMGRYDFLCVDCHQTEDHRISGRAMSVSVDSANGAACTDCHTTDLHADARITEHLDTVACQTCHIPNTALRDPTKVEWDWSQAGDPTREEDPHIYLRIKGAFLYEYNYQPTYMWFNGTVSRYLMGDEIDPNATTHINYPQGSIDDTGALIFPFKIHYARQPYDSVNNILLPPHTTGEDGYWSTFDWDSALRIGAEAAGLPYSGEYDFARTDMYWTQTHMVQPAANALTCTDCHGEAGRLDWEALGYPGDPMVWGGRTP
jgi:octaheme c-type cytochrome (tetrathionate reductase family)